ncbi:phage P22-like portal protein [Bacteriophage sp.]|nr:phage P22-like portal protein [Bacteriophage sp.]UOF80117.1 phage P22-like portal protein [Bacteriophage sp.]
MVAIGSMPESAPLIGLDKDNLSEVRASIDSRLLEATSQIDKRRERLRRAYYFFRGIHHGLDQSRNFYFDNGAFSIDDRATAETIQLVRPTARQEVATYLAHLPKVNAVAVQTGPIAQYMAEGKQKLARSIVRTAPRLYRALYNARLSAAVFGACWLKTFWDPRIGPATKIPAMPRAGDWNTIPVSILDFIPDPSAITPDDVNFGWHRQVLPRWLAEERWPVDVFGASTSGAFQVYSATSRQSSIQAFDDPRAAGVSTAMDSLVEVIHFYHKEAGQYPQGLMMSYSGGTIIAFPSDETTGVPMLPDGIWPFTLITGINKVFDRLYPDGFFQDTRSIQIFLNHLMGRLRSQVNLSSQNTFLSPRSANLQEGALTNMDGDVLEYDPANGKPEWVRGPGPDQALMSLVELTRVMHNDVSTQSDAARGLQQSSQANARLLAYQQELSFSVHRPDVNMWAWEVIEVMENIFALIRENYGPDRTLLFYGPNGQVFSQLFRNFPADYAAPLTYDPTQPLAVSREVEHGRLLEAFQVGALEDTPSAKRFRRLAGKFTLDEETVDPAELQRQNAQEEDVQFLLTGVMAPVMDNDDSEVHLYQHQMTQLTAGFRALPTAQRELHKQHMIIHQEMLNMQLMATAATPGQPQKSKGISTAGRGAASPQSGGASPQPSALAGEKSAYSEGSDVSVDSTG